MTLHETGVGSPGNENANHWMALKREEAERKKAEVSRMLLGSQLPPAGDALTGLVDLLKDPKATLKRVADLAEATRKSNEAAAAAQRETANLKQAEQNLSAVRKANDAAIERSQSERAAWVAKERSEIESEKKAVAALKAQAEADFAAAAKAKSIAERRLKAMESVS
jgi:hypothetical protein